MCALPLFLANGVDGRVVNGGTDMVIFPALDVEKSLRTSSMESTKPSCRSGIALLAVL